MCPVLLDTEGEEGHENSALFSPTNLNTICASETTVGTCKKHISKKASQHIHQKIKFKMLFVCLASPVKSTEINFYLSLGGFFMFAFLLFMWNEKAPTDLKSKLKVLNLTHCAEMLNI